MSIYALEKLVRDSSVANMEDKGAVVRWHTLDEPAFKRALLDKLREETLELETAHGEAILEELADVLEIVRGLAMAHGSTLTALEELRAAKHAKRGGFDQRVYVTQIECPEGSFWDAYCAQDAQKYPRLA